MSPRLEFALEAAHRAGRLTLSYFQTGTAVERKADGTPVTEADRGAERLIREMIAARFPGEAILGEEEGASGNLGGQRTGWILDPIDGTKSFVCGVPLYATLVSFEEGGEPVLGVCAFPALGETVYAERGAGAYWNGRRCAVSSVSRLEDAFISSGSQFSMQKSGREPGFQKLVASTRATRTWTDAYGHALVATGRIEAMVDPIVAPWDISAMRLIVREAGGRFTDFGGGEDPQSEAVASNGALHDRILEVFRP
jgi:histidinol phosphatase-like enzyme (inositol monophosphatase family)